MKTLTLGILVLSLLLLHPTAANYLTTLSPFTFTSSSSRVFTIELDISSAYDISIESYKGPNGLISTCTPAASQIGSTVKWSGIISLPGKSFDNIVYYRGEYFALDSVDWTVLVTSDLSDPSKYSFIEFSSTISRPKSTDTPFLLIDDNFNVLYIIRNDMMVHYELSAFYAARKSGSEIPKISSKNENFKVYNNIKDVKFYAKSIFVIADNIVDVWRPEYLKGVIFDPSNTLDADFFGVDAVSISDIAFQGNYAFVLDQLSGVYVVDVSADKLVPKSSLKQNIQDGIFIEILGDSLNVVSSNSRTTQLDEYLIVLSPTLSLSHTRKVDIRDVVRDTFSDSNFLYLTTGFQNLVAKHSIPTTYNTDAVKNSYTTPWTLSNIGAAISVPSSETGKSTAVVIQGRQVTVYEFAETKATLNCNAVNAAPGLYTYTLKATQKSCAANPSGACDVKQTVSIVIPSAFSNQIEDNSDSGSWLIAVIVILVFVVSIGVVYWFYKRPKRPKWNPISNSFSMLRRLSRTPLTNSEATDIYKISSMDPDRSGITGMTQEIRKIEHNDLEKSPDMEKRELRHDFGKGSPADAAHKKLAAIGKVRSFDEEKGEIPVKRNKTKAITLAAFDNDKDDSDGDI